MAALYLLYRGFRTPAYLSHLGERFGLLPEAMEPTGAGTVWLHAVSVGEILSSVELLRQMRGKRPTVQIYVSTTTLAGRAMAEQRLKGLARGVFYAPFDYRFAVRSVLRRLRPSLVVILETEIWPNIYREAKRAGASLVLVNGRISDRALPRYRRWRWFFQHVLRWPDAILAQTQTDATRFVEAGAPADRVRVSGNLKYDLPVSSTTIAEDLAAFFASRPSARVVIAASTMPPAAPDDVDEDDAVIGAFKKLAVREPNLLLVLVPRKPERFPLAAGKLEAEQVSFIKRTALREVELPAVLLLDSMGELAALFSKADAVFMGGTLARCGGHNILEPAQFGKAIIVGPHMENFAEIAQEFRQADALIHIGAASELAEAISDLLSDGERRTRAGTNALRAARAKQGVTAQIMDQLWSAYDDAVPAFPHSLLARVFLTPLSWLWQAGTRRRQCKDLAMRRSLHAPVISVGGIAMGGAGKTPLVNHLAARLSEKGRNPAILTRGYRRKGGEEVVLVKRGRKATLDLTGDEAQIFIRSGHAHVGISADRFSAGLQVERQLAPDVFLLDDGFQHRRLARQHDLVLIDALDPFGGGVFPLGRCREPGEALKRATAIMLARVEFEHRNSGIERMIRRWNPRAPLFRSRILAERWIEAGSGREFDVGCAPFKKVAAFCGLGNPRSFWSTLESLNMEIVFRWPFADHHVYRPAELEHVKEQAVQHGAEALVTTEKDFINLPDSASEKLAPIPLFWLRVGIEIENEDELLRLIDTTPSA